MTAKNIFVVFLLSHKCERFVRLRNIGISMCLMIVVSSVLCMPCLCVLYFLFLVSLSSSNSIYVLCQQRASDGSLVLCYCHVLNVILALLLYVVPITQLIAGGKQLDGVVLVKVSNVSLRFVNMIWSLYAIWCVTFISCSLNNLLAIS